MDRIIRECLREADDAIALGKRAIAMVDRLLGFAEDLQKENEELKKKLKHKEK